MKLCIAHGGDLTDPSGGTDRVSALASGLTDRGHDVTVVAPRESGRFPDRLASVDIRPVDTRTGGSVMTALGITREAARIADRQGAVLQFEHSTLAGVGTLHGQSGYVLDMHDLAHSRFDVLDTVAAPILERATAWLERRAVRRADHVVAVSEAMRDVLCGCWDVAPEQVSVVANGYFPERIQPFAGVDPVEGRVAFLGTLHPKVDVEAFRALADLPAVSELVVIGDGGLRDDMERLATSRETVRYTGRLPDSEAFSLLAGAQVAINPQTPSELQRSSSPVKLYNYAALGLPMVVSPGPSVVEELVAADAAVTASGCDQFERAVERLVNDDARRRTLSENATEIAENFQWDRRVTAVEEVYKRMSTGGGT